MMKGYSRRDVLRIGAAVGGAALLPALPGCGDDGAPTGSVGGPEPADGGVRVAFNAAAVAQDDARFPTAALAGAMTANAAWVCARTLGDGPHTLRVWRETRTAGQVALVAERAVMPAEGGYVKERIEGLAPGVRYRFALFAGAPAAAGGAPAFSARSPIGGFRTAIADDALEPVTIAGATCTNLTKAPFRSMEALKNEPVDMFVHLGDFVYQDSETTLEGYRRVWRDTLADAGSRGVFSQAGLYATWDDHEVDDNWDPETYNPTRIGWGKQTWFEALPLDRGENDRLWANYRWGRTLEVFVLDCRSERKPSTIRSDTPVYIGEAQMAWLKQGLKNSPARFKVVLNSVPITGLPRIWAFQGDRWAGYEKQRDELLRFIRDENVSDVWFLSGDFHVGFVARADTALQPRPKVWEVAVGPGASDLNPLPGLVEKGILRREETIPDSIFRFFTGRTANTTTLTFDPATGGVRIRFVDATNGEVLFDETVFAADA